jgi:feruloyl esterase
MRSMFGGAFLILSFAHMTAFADPAAKCASLTSAKLSAPPGASSLAIDSTTLVSATSDVPEYCLVIGHLDTEINFNVELPTAWNGKLMMEGSASFAGFLPDLDYDVSLHYAAVGTDLGQTGDPADLLNRPDRITNLMYRSTHLVALAAKGIVQAYYRTRPQHAYFSGCSRGGTQGMMEAARFPTDFDGIIAGDPSLSSGGARVWNEQAVFPGGPANGGLIPSSKVALLSALVLKKCDSRDRVVDGVVADPRACNFSPKDELPRCRNDVDGPNCFTNAQVTALQKIHQGPHSNGQPIGVPYYFSGNEGYNYGDAFGVGEDILDYAYTVTGFPENPLLFPDFFDVGMPSWAYWLETMNLRYMVFSDPAYQLSAFDFNQPSDVNRYNTAMNRQSPASPDLSSFGRAGGKLILFHGLADALTNSEMSREFYEAGAAAVGGYGNVKSFYRLFLVPGMLHCGGGPGPWAFDPLPALEKWVEHGQPPKSIEGFAPDSNTSKPNCAYPKQARLTSQSADPALAASYRCVNVESEPDDVN